MALIADVLMHPLSALRALASGAIFLRRCF